ncbi:MAG: DUF305 domain-containing protein [Solirubrobacterales bacterium]
MKLRTLAVTLAIAAFALVAGGCGDDDAATSSDNGGNRVDAMFVTGMIPHHQSAIEMAELGVKSADHEEIKTLSENIIASQNAEIKQMTELEKSLPNNADSMMSSEDMAAMMSDVDALKAAKDFDMAFIDAMIPHHQSAVVMANQVLAEGMNPEVMKLAAAIVKAQSKEIAQMQTWRTEWFGSPLPTEKVGSMGSMH